MINDFSRIFDRSLEDFIKYENKKKIVEVLFEAKENINDVISLIRSDLNEEGYIFTNLLYLFPFSSDIVSEVLKKGLLEEKDLLNRIDIIFETTSNMGKLLTEIKKLIRNDGFAFSKIEERLEEVNRELAKYEKELQKKQELKEKLNKLNYIKGEVNNIKELEEFIDKLQSNKVTLERLKKEIEKSKRVFRDVCKGEV